MAVKWLCNCRVPDAAQDRATSGMKELLLQLGITITDVADPRLYPYAVVSSWIGAVMLTLLHSGAAILKPAFNLLGAIDARVST